MMRRPAELIQAPDESVAPSKIEDMAVTERFLYRQPPGVAGSSR